MVVNHLILDGGGSRDLDRIVELVNERDRNLILNIAWSNRQIDFYLMWTSD